MLTRWYDVDKEMAALDELARRMDRLFGGGRGLAAGEGGTLLTSGWPRASLYDTGSSLVAVLQVPGLSHEDLKVEVHGDALTVSGERKVAPPAGYRVHRAERASRSFSRSFGLPCRVDSEKVSASLKDGLLTISMDKHAEAKPKQITVSAS